MADRARWLVGGLLAGSAFLLGVVQIEDTDAWTHLALGRQIVAARGFPAAEALNFPSTALPYQNPEWLFGLLLYLVYAGAGLGGVILVKAALAASAFLVLFVDCLAPRDPPERRGVGLLAACLVLVPVLVLVRHRFVERPDLALMLFLALTTWALHAYVHEGRRYLFGLPALQLVWVNTHPSIVLGLVPFVAVLVGGGLEWAVRAWRGVQGPATPSPRQLRLVAAVLALVALASLANPYGIEPYLMPFRMADSAWLRHEIAELQPPRLGRENAPFVLVALLAVGFLLTLRRLSVSSVVLVAPFVVLGLSARRFMFLLAVVAAPVLARQLRTVLGALPARWTAGAEIPAMVLAAGVVLAVPAFWAAGLRPVADPLKVPGFAANHSTVPEGALRYLDRVGAAGRVFNTYHWGGYIAWRDIPRRIPFVDGRGHLPPGLLEEAQLARRSSPAFERLQGRYGFEIAILDYPVLSGALAGEPPAGDVALRSDDWALVYWDDLALVYLRRSGPLAAAAARDEYRHVKPANGAGLLRARLRQGVPMAALEAELRRNVGETDSSVGWALLGFLYNETGRHRQAIEALGRVRDVAVGGSHLFNAYQGLGYAHWRLDEPARAAVAYAKALAIREDADVLFNLGVALDRLGRRRQAIHHLERAIARDPRLVAAYPALSRAYRAAGRDDRARELEAAYPQALVVAQAQEHFTRGLRLYMDGDHHGALAAFTMSVNLNPGNAAALSNLGYVYFDLGQMEQAFEYQRRALAVDPRFANAHYGLAMIHERRGEAPQARAHYAEYLRLDPRGYFARRAQEAVQRHRGS